MVAVAQFVYIDTVVFATAAVAGVSATVAVKLCGTVESRWMSVLMAAQVHPGRHLLAWMLLAVPTCRHHCGCYLGFVVQLRCLTLEGLSADVFGGPLLMMFCLLGMMQWIAAGRLLHRSATVLPCRMSAQDEGCYTSVVLLMFSCTPAKHDG